MAFNLISLEMQNIITEMWPRQNGRHIADAILQCIFVNQNFEFVSIFRRGSNVIKKEIVKKYFVDRY